MRGFTVFNRWLEEVLFHVSSELKLSLQSTRLSLQEVKEKKLRLEERMQELQKLKQCKFEELGEYQKKILENIIEKLESHLKSDKIVKQFCEWSASEAPALRKTWRETKHEVLICISERIEKFVQSWEEETHEFAMGQDKLIAFCCEKYDIMKHEIDEVAKDLFSDEVDPDVRQKNDEVRTKPQALSRGMKLIAGTLPSWQTRGIVPVLDRSPGRMLSFKTKKPNDITKRQLYEEDRCGYMSQRSKKCVEKICSKEGLLPVINEQLRDAVDFLGRIKERITKLLESDRQMYENLLDAKTSETVKYEPLSREADLLEHKLIVFGLTEIRKSDFTSDELKWGGHDSIIGSGSFSTVYKGVRAQWEKPEEAVAIKEYKDPLTTRNLWHFVDEERALRFVLERPIDIYHHVIPVMARPQLIHFAHNVNW